MTSILHIDQLSTESREFISISYYYELEHQIPIGEKRLEYYTIFYTKELTEDLVPLTIEFITGNSK
ncbi:hypothetical protein ACSVDA_12645 [Cytobacillus sp. Hm23]